MGEATYQEESFDVVYPAVKAMLEAHYREIAQDQEKMPLDVDVDGYRKLEAMGSLSIVTARLEGNIVGYFVSFIRPHLHYQSTLCAYADIYYVAPEYRNHALGLRLFMAAEAILKARGVQKLFASHKVYADHGALFLGLRWVPTETVYSKWIGD